jgi:hypothetical protein
MRPSECGEQQEWHWNKAEAPLLGSNLRTTSARPGLVDLDDGTYKKGCDWLCQR